MKNLVRKCWKMNARRLLHNCDETISEKIKQSKVPLRFRKVGRVWCGGSRETHWAMYRNPVTPSKTKEFLPAFLDLNGILIKPFILCMYKDFTESGIFEFIWLYAYIIYLHLIYFSPIKYWNTDFRRFYESIVRQLYRFEFFSPRSIIDVVKKLLPKLKAKKLPMPSKAP